MNSSSDLSGLFEYGEVPLRKKISLIKMRRLTINEYDNSVAMILGDHSRPAASRLSKDVKNSGFDTNADLQDVIGAPIVQAYEELAYDIAQRLVSDSNRLEVLLTCSPSSPSDESCYRTFIERVLTLAYSQTPSKEKLDHFISFAKRQGESLDDFLFGIEMFVAAILQSPEFLYYSLQGKEVYSKESIFELSSYEMARRLSLTLTARLPDLELIKAAESGLLLTQKGIKDEAERLLETPEALRNVQRFHAMWLGYSDLNMEPELAQDLQLESASLVKKVLWEEQLPWSSLFTYNKTYINDNLATHYGFPFPSSGFDWVEYPVGSQRSGILSHGAVLTSGAKFGDTTPVGRGKFILSKVLCREVESPPPELDVDVPPPDIGGANCKIDRYIAMSPPGTACYSCHSRLDPVGFGLEQFDSSGKQRFTEKNKPECEIDGEGRLKDYGGYSGGDFNGPGELSSIITTSGEVQNCMSKKLYEFVSGRFLDLKDEPAITKIRSHFSNNNEDFRALLLDLVISEEFKYVKKEM